jgi:hypothetical protein
LADGRKARDGTPGSVARAARREAQSKSDSQGMEACAPRPVTL